MSYGNLVPMTPDWKNTRRRQLQIFTGLLFEMGMPGGTVRFFSQCYDYFITGGEFTISELADRAELTKQGAAKHVHKLTRAGVLRRNHYRSWSLNEDKIRELNRRLM